MDYFDEMQRKWGTLSDFDKRMAAASKGMSQSEFQNKMFNQTIKKEQMKNDLIIAGCILVVGMMVGSLITVAIIPPKITHEVYLYRPKVKNSERVEFLIQQIETDTIQERKVLRNLFKMRKRKGGKND